MQKQFNDIVFFVRNGRAVPAIVLKSQLVGAEGKEILSLLFADPATGPSLVLAGSTRKVGSVELAVPPLTVGAAYGWRNLVVHPQEIADLQEHHAAAVAGKPAPELDLDEDDLPGNHGHPKQSDESEQDKAARLANVAHAESIKATGAPPIERPAKPNPTSLAGIESLSSQATGQTDPGQGAIAGSQAPLDTQDISQRIGGNEAGQEQQSQ